MMSLKKVTVFHKKSGSKKTIMIDPESVYVDYDIDPAFCRITDTRRCHPPRERQYHNKPKWR